MTVYEIEIMIRTALNEVHQQRIFATSSVELGALQQLIESNGGKFAVAVTPREVLTHDAPGLVELIEDWALGHFEDEAAPQVAVVHPENAAINELKRAQVNTDRQMATILAGMAELTKAVTTALASPRQAPREDDQEDAANWREAMPAQPVQRRSMRKQLTEFKGSSEHRDNSMGIQTGPSASPMPGASPMYGGTGTIAITGIDGDGNPIVGNVPPMTVGDSLKRFSVS